MMLHASRAFGPFISRAFDSLVRRDASRIPNPRPHRRSQEASSARRPERHRRLFRCRLRKRRLLQHKVPFAHRPFAGRASPRSAHLLWRLRVTLAVLLHPSVLPAALSAVLIPAKIARSEKRGRRAFCESVRGRRDWGQAVRCFPYGGLPEDLRGAKSEGRHVSVAAEESVLRRGSCAKG